MFTIKMFSGAVFFYLSFFFLKIRPGWLLLSRTVNVQRLLPYQWVSMWQQSPLVSTDRTTENNKTASQDCLGHWPEFVSSLDKLLVYSLCFHIRIQWVTPVTQSHWVCSAAACNWEPNIQINPFNSKTGLACSLAVLVKEDGQSRVTVPVSLQTAGPLSAAMSSWVERGQHAPIVDADFPDSRQPLIKLIHILVRQKHTLSLQPKQHKYELLLKNKMCF